LTEVEPIVPGDFVGCLVPEGGTLRDAMSSLDRGRRRIALAVDSKGRLVGVATDGDIRRALLAGAGLDDPLGPALSYSFASVPRRVGRADVLDLMRARGIEAVPVVDDEGRPVGLHLVNEFIDPVRRPNQAVVMAGGLGVRLRPLTDSIPKPMLLVAGRPILERIVLHLVGHGITRIYLAVHYKADVVEEHFGDGSRFGCRIEYLREEEPLGTAGALGLISSAPLEPLLVMNGDLITTADFSAMLDYHVTGGFDATVGIRRYVHAIPFGVVERDGDQLVSIEEKPNLTRDVLTGIYLLNPSVVARVERGSPLDMPALLAASLERGEAIGLFGVEGDWIDVGQREQLDRARGTT
jgi:dTDP-glucose pyrophosphorylase